MKKVVSILSAMTVLCALFAGCTTNTPDDNSPQNNSTSDTSPADNRYENLSHGSHSTSKQP